MQILETSYCPTSGECGADDDGKDEVNISLHDAPEEGNIDTVKVVARTGNGYQRPQCK